MRISDWSSDVCSSDLLSKMGGLWARFPHLPPIALFFSIAALGMPGFGNFVGEFLILLGSWPISPLLTILASTGLVFGAVYALILVQRAFHGAPAEGRSEERRVGNGFVRRCRFGWSPYH